jgi:hypothetical protein
VREYKTGTGVPCPYGGARTGTGVPCPYRGARTGTGVPCPYWGSEDGHGCPVPLQAVGCCLPFHWIFEDVSACLGELLAVPDNPLVVVALPDN